MSNPATARKLVLLSVMGLLVVATFKGKSGKVPTSTRLWGTGWLAVMLGVAADVAPQIAGPFALLILAGSLTNGGDKAFTNLLDKAGASSGPTHSGGGHSIPPGPTRKAPGGAPVAGPVPSSKGARP